MASKVDIWNMAMSNIGHRARIADPDETTAEANHCRRYYSIALGVTLERYAWSFATRRESLAVVTNPVDHWAYAYALPNGCVKPRAILLPESTDDTKEQPYTVETTTDDDIILYTNVEDAVLKYTALVTDTVKFSYMFVTALSYDLGAFLVGPIPKDLKLKTEMTKLAEYYTGMAEASDANAAVDVSYQGYVPSHLSARS